MCRRITIRPCLFASLHNHERPSSQPMTQVPQQTDAWRCGWYTVKNVECILRQHATLSSLNVQNAATAAKGNAYDVDEVDECREEMEARLREELS